MTNSLQPYLPPADEFRQLQIVANAAMQSGLYGGVGGEQKIFMILLAARELGIPPMQALNGGIWNIQGKVEISPRLMASMVRRAGHSIDIQICNDQECVLVGKRIDNGDTHTAKFTMQDAKDAGLAGRGAWKSYGEDMLYARAMSRLARRLFPDVIGTSYVQGEIAPTLSKVERLEQPKDEVQVIEAYIDQEKLANIQNLLSTCDCEYIEKLHKYLNGTGVTELKYLPNQRYKSIVESIERHIQSTTEEKIECVSSS